MKNKEKYLVELSESEVKSIGYRRWMNKKNIFKWMFASLTWMVLVMIVTALIEALNGYNWLIYPAVTPMVILMIYVACKETKSEKSFLEEIKKSQVTNLR